MIKGIDFAPIRLNSDPVEDGPIRVHYRTNDGDDDHLDAETMDQALELAKQVRVTSNHMVCILADEMRVQRWDRDRIVGENRWRPVDPDTMETLGPIRAVTRSKACPPNLDSEI
jgi:hypothetical protein